MWQKRTVETLALSFSKFSKVFIASSNDAQSWRKF